LVACQKRLGNTVLGGRLPELYDQAGSPLPELKASLPIGKYQITLHDDKSHMHVAAVGETRTCDLPIDNHSSDSTEPHCDKTIMVTKNKTDLAARVNSLL